MISAFDSKQDKKMADLVHSIDSPIFPEVLSYFVSQLIEFDNLIVLVYNKNHKPEELYRESFDPIVHKRIQTHYIKGAYLLDPFYHMVRSGVQTGVYTIFELAPDQFTNTSYFNEYYSATNLIDEFALFAPLGHQMTLTACFGRDVSKGKSFTPAELHKIKETKNVLSALCTHHWRNFQPKEDANVVLPALPERLRKAISDQCGVSLTPRQAEVAIYILQGHSSLSISLHLNISKETVKVFRRQLYKKCNISSQAELFSLLIPVLSTV